MTDNATPEGGSTCRLIPTEDQHNYGMDGVRVITSDNPNATYEPSPGIFAVGHEEDPRRLLGVLMPGDFSKCWHEHLEAPFLETLTSSFPVKTKWRMNILRSDFDRDVTKNPITIIIVVCDEGEGVPDDSNILDTLQALNKSLENFWSTER
jgi:hypothetical protein